MDIDLSKFRSAELLKDFIKAANAFNAVMEGWGQVSDEDCAELIFIDYGDPKHDSLPGLPKWIRFAAFHDEPLLAKELGSVDVETDGKGVRDVVAKVFQEQTDLSINPEGWDQHSWGVALQPPSASHGHFEDERGSLWRFEVGEMKGMLCLLFFTLVDEAIDQSIFGGDGESDDSVDPEDDYPG